MPKYSQFTNFLESQKESVSLSFSEIEDIVGKLPRSAYDHKAWWTNHPSHPLMKVVLDAGWRQKNLDLFLKKVEFFKKNQSILQKPLKQEPPKLIKENKIPPKAIIQINEDSLSLEGYEFSHVCKISPETDSQNNILEIMPQNNYENKNNLKLNKYGNGPFCKFSIDKKYIGMSGVYIITVDKKINYVGECDDFFNRFVMGYGNISPRNCFEGGQPTNCRINNLILNSILTNSSVHLYFLETSERFKIEHFMILKFNPRWNLTMGKPSKISEIKSEISRIEIH